MTRTEYIAKQKLQLDAWTKNINVLEAKALKVKENHNKKLELLHSYQAAGLKQMDLLKASSEETWKKVKDESKHVWVALKDSLRQFQTHFK